MIQGLRCDKDRCVHNSQGGRMVFRFGETAGRRIEPNRCTLKQHLAWDETECRDYQEEETCQ